MLFGYAIIYIYMFLMNFLDRLRAVLKFKKRDGSGGCRSLYEKTRNFLVTSVAVFSGNVGWHMSRCSVPYYFRHAKD